MRGRGLLFGALLCAGCLSAVASQALFVREESLAQLRDTRSTSSQTGNFNNNNNSNNNNFDNHSSRSGRSGANGSRRTSSRRAPVSPDSLQQPQQQQDRSNPPPWDLSHHSTSRRRPTGPSQDSNGGDQDFLKTSQSQYPRQQYNQQYNNNFNQKASQYQKPQNQAFQKTASKSHDYDDLSNDQYNAQAQFSQNTFSQQNNQFNNNNFNRNQPTGNNQFGGGNQFGNQQTSNNFNNDARVNNQPRGSNFNTDGGRAATHFESTRNQFRQGRQFQNGSNQKPQQQAGRQDQSQQPFRQEHEQPLRQQHNQQPFRQQQQSRQSQNKQSFRQDQTQQPVRQDQSFRQDQNHQPSRQDQNQFNNFNGFNNNNNNQGLHDNNFNNNHFHQQSSTSQRSRTPQQNANFNSFNSVNNNFNKIKSHNNDDNDIHRLSPTTPPNNNNYVIFPTGSDDQIPFNNQGVNNNNNIQRQPVAQQEQPRAPVTLTGQRNVQPQSDPTRESQPNNRAARVPSQPHSTVSIDQTVQSILNWIQGMSRAQERRARQQGVGQPSRQYLPVPEATERPRPFQPAVNPPTEPARQQGVTPPSRQYLPVPESPATEAPRPFETPAPEAPTTGPADTPYETPAPGGPVPTGPEQPTGPGPEPAPGPEPVPIPIPETPSPELETPSPATEPAPTEVPFTEAPATPAPTETPTPAEYPTPAAPPGKDSQGVSACSIASLGRDDRLALEHDSRAKETPAPETPPPEVYTEAPATPAPEVQTEAPTPAPEAPLPEAPAPEAPAETPAPEAPVYTPAPEYPTEAPTIAPEAPAPEAPAPEVPAPEAPAPTAPEQPAPVPTGPATATPVDDGLHPPHIHAIDVQCAKDMMTITIEFDKPYDGIIYSKGFYKDANCRYVQPNSNQIKYTFTVMLNSCGTQFVDDFQGGSGQAYLENVIVLQNEEGIQEVWDSIRSVRCLWEGNLKQALTVALSVGNLNQEIVTFGGDTGMAKLDIQVGRGPFAPTANGLVKIGEMMTLVVTVEGDPGFDVQVRACVARDADSTNLVPLTDNDGCVLKPKLLGAFQKTKDTGNTGASIIAYAFFQAFKFPDVMDLIIECSVDLCKTDCEMCPNPNQKLEPGARRRRRDVWSAGNATRAALRNAEVDSEGLVGDDLGVVMGRRLRVFTPDELPTDLVLEGFNATALQHETYGDNVIHVTSDPSREDAVCMSVPSFAASSALMLSLLTGSCLLSATLWLKLQRSVLGKQKQRSLAHALVTQ